MHTVVSRDRVKSVKKASPDRTVELAVHLPFASVHARLFNLVGWVAWHQGCASDGAHWRYFRVEFTRIAVSHAPDVIDTSCGRACSGRMYETTYLTVPGCHLYVFVAPLGCVGALGAHSVLFLGTGRYESVVFLH